jgi:hypothetical protein
MHGLTVMGFQRQVTVLPRVPLLSFSTSAVGLPRAPLLSFSTSIVSLPHVILCSNGGGIFLLVHSADLFWRQPGRRPALLPPTRQGQHRIVALCSSYLISSRSCESHITAPESQVSPPQSHLRDVQYQTTGEMCGTHTLCA